MDKYILIFLTFLTAMSCKSKTELYLERGLDILSNKKEVNFQLFKDVWVKEIGVIRDQKLEKKTLILNLKDTLGKAMFEIDDMIGVRVWIIDDNKVKRVENWDFKPLIVYRKGFKYLLKEIKMHYWFCPGLLKAFSYNLFRSALRQESLARPRPTFWSLLVDLKG